MHRQVISNREPRCSDLAAHPPAQSLGVTSTRDFNPSASRLGVHRPHAVEGNLLGAGPFPASRRLGIVGLQPTQGAGMGFFTWSFGYEVGIDLVDADHRRLFEILRRLHDGIAAGWAAPAVGCALRDLARHCQAHFEREEDLLDASGCPELVRQRGEHTGLLAHLADLESSRAELSLATVTRMRDFLLTHIQEGDRRYAGWLARASPEAVTDWARRRALAAMPRV